MINKKDRLNKFKSVIRKVKDRRLILTNWFIQYLIKVSVGDGRELLLERLQKPNGNIEAVVGWVCLLSSEPHGSERTSGLGLHIICTSWVPPEQLKKKNQSHTHTYSIHTYNERVHVRDTEHEWSAVLLSDEASELPLAFLHGLLVILANSGVILRHLFNCFQNKKQF